MNKLITALILLFNIYYSYGQIQLNANFDSTSSDVLPTFKISDDGQTVVYMADQNIDEMFELFSVPIKGGEPINLHPNLIPEEQVLSTSFSISPDGKWVIYSVREFGKSNLFSVASTGGTPVQLNEEFLNYGTIYSFSISPDSNTVIYNSSLPDQTLQDGLFSVPINGGIPVKLNQFENDLFDIRNFLINSTSNKVVYLIIQNGIHNIYSVNFDGTNQTRLNSQLLEGADVDEDSYKINNQGNIVIYLADQDIVDKLELYSVPINGGIPTKLNNELVTNGNVRDDFKLANDDITIVYTADQNIDEKIEVFSVPIYGGEPINLNENFPDEGGINGTFLISPNSKTVVYRGIQKIGDFELFSIPITGGNPVRLNIDLPIGGNVFPRWNISPNGQTVLYISEQDSDLKNELYSVPIVGGIPIKLNNELPFKTNITSGFVIPENSNSVIYMNEFDSTYSVAINGGEVTELNTSGKIINFSLSGDFQNIVYVANQNKSSVDEIFSIPVINYDITLSNTVNDIEDLKIKIFPNPSNEYLSVYSKNKYLSLEIYDMQGKSLKTSYSNSTNYYDISALSNGTYLLKIIFNNNETLSKLIIKQ